MKKKYRSFTADYKRQVIAAIDGGEKTLSQAARDEEISPSLLRRWRDQILFGTLQDKPTRREKQLEKELDQYKKKVGELTMQVELLKKIADYSAQVRKSNGSVVTGPNAVSNKGAH